jgi:acetyl-CoA carboxylase biotin carboxyl carrier protein
MQGVREVTDIRAEMSASVFKVHVVVGDRVQADDAVMTLESMKMEIPVLASISGGVSALLVAEGAAVSEGDVLASVEPG